MTKLVECMLSYLIHGSILPKKSLFIAHTTTVEIQTYYRKDLTFICFSFRNKCCFQMTLCTPKRIANMNDYMNDFPNNWNNEPKFLTTEDLNLDPAMVSVSVIIYVNVTMTTMHCVCVISNGFFL